MTLWLCIEIHDVAPATWRQCLQLFNLIDELGGPPLTLLAVPDFHATGRMRDAPHVARSLQLRVEAGDEVALHGYLHRDDAPPPRAARDWLRRRVLTAGEGEFAALTHGEALHRLRHGCEDLNALFVGVRGFVAPAWLASRGTWSALRDSPLSYTATRSELVVLDGMRRVAAPAISASTRTPLRRLASRAWLRAHATASGPVLRAALHAADADHPRIMESWRMLLNSLLAHREPVTVARVLGLS